MSADPVSWLMIEPGWHVVDASGERVGKVEAVTGDSNADIFDGLAVATDLLARPKYVPSEQVGTITDGTVQLKLERSAFNALGEYEDPADSVEILHVLSDTHLVSTQGPVWILDGQTI